TSATALAHTSDFKENPTVIGGALLQLFNEGFFLLDVAWGRGPVPPLRDLAQIQRNLGPQNPLELPCWRLVSAQSNFPIFRRTETRNWKALELSGLVLDRAGICQLVHSPDLPSFL